MARSRKRSAKEEIHEALDSSTLRAVARGSHHHVAELYGESETRHLRPWAKRAVLTRKARR